MSATTQAAAVLAEYAESLKDCHTVDGDWRDETEARAEYDRLKRIAAALTTCVDCGAPIQDDEPWRYKYLCYGCAVHHFE